MSITSPGESTSSLFGGNSNWRGPVWFPINYLLIEALERYHHFYGNTLKVECPTGPRQQDESSTGCRRVAQSLGSVFSSPTPTDTVPATATNHATPPIRSGKIWCCSTNISMATTAVVSVPATKRVGQRSPPRAWRILPHTSAEKKNQRDVAWK